MGSKEEKQEAAAKEAATKEPAPAAAKKKGRKKVTHEQARAACMRVMEEMFDLPAVLRGRKPVSQLAGLWPIAGWFCTVFVGMGMTVLNANTMRDTQSTLYLRNFGSFARAMGASVSVVILDSINQAVQQFFRTRIAYAWRQQLQDTLHSTYFRDMVYYRQTTWGDSIPDPGQRITRDIGMLAFELRIFCTSLVNEILRAVQAVWRIYWLLPEQRWLIPFIICWSWGNLAFRNFFSPALERGLLMAKQSRISGAFRDAHSRLAQHGEGVISFGGVAAEARRLNSRLDATLALSRRMSWLFIKERFTMSISGEIISQTLTSSLVQVPMIAADYHLKAPPNASEALRMKANADMLAQMTFNDQLVRDLQMYVGHLSRLGRSL